MRIAAALLLLLLAACGDDTDATSTPEETTVTTPSDPRIAAAVADLASREGVDPGDVTVAEVRDVTWSDGSLGCPKPGMSYTMALVPGTLAVLEVDGRRFEYHGATQGDLRYCETPKAPAS
ncbi:MAG TPA: hypothetical protein VFK52_06345 [Nocardioidaceae bacterium]|nr:hypothetical protein [Nocardioidaceae bacterium]